MDAEGAFEMTALMWAKRKGHTEIVELLRKAGAREITFLPATPLASTLCCGG